MLTLALLVLGLQQAPGATPAQSDVRTTLEKLEIEWNVAHLRGDAAALDRIFSDDVVIIVPAIATGRVKRTRVINGARRDDDWRFTKVYLRRADRWQVISFHASNTGS